MTERRVPLLDANEVTVRRGDVIVVKDFTWSHRPGSIAWLTGPNGAGKSSLLRVLAGLAEPSAGTVARSGRGVSYYHPSMSLPPEPRARAFARLATRLVPGDHPLAPDRALGSKRCGALSTGEEKRLLLGPVLERGRDLLFLDEPYEHLSREAREQLTEALRAYARERIVLVATNQPLPDGESGPLLTLSLTETARIA